MFRGGEENWRNRVRRGPAGIEAFVYIDVNARNIPVANGCAEYTWLRLDTGARYAFTVLTSNDFADSGSVSSEFFSPWNLRGNSCTDGPNCRVSCSIPTGNAGPDRS